MLRRHPRLRARSLTVFALALLTMSLTAASASAAQNTWEGDDATFPTRWTEAANWSDGVPTGDDTLLIPSGSTITAIPATPTVSGIEIGTGSSLTGSSSVLAVVDGEVNIESGVTWSGIQLNLDGVNIVGAGSTFATPVRVVADSSIDTNADFTSAVTFVAGAELALSSNEPTITFTAGAVGTVAVTGTGGLQLEQGTYGAVAAGPDVFTNLGEEGSTTVSGTSTFGGAVNLRDNTVALNASGNTFGNFVDSNDGGTATIGANASFTNADSFHNYTSGSVSIELPINEFAGRISIAGGTFATTGSGAATFESTMNVSSGTATFAGTTTFGPDAQFNIEGGTANFNGTSIFNSEVFVDGGAPTFTSSTFNGYSDFSSAFGGQTLNFGADAETYVEGPMTTGMAVMVTNAGTMTVQDGGTFGAPMGLSFTNSGNVSIKKPLSLTGVGNGTVVNSGTITLDPGAGATVSAAGLGASTFTNSGELYINSGTLSAQAFTQTTTGTLTPRLVSAGSTPGTNFGTLSATGEANLSGKLWVSSADGYPQPTLATTPIPVITYGSLNGTNNAFTSTMGAGFENGFYLAPSAPKPTGVDLVVGQGTVSFSRTTANPGDTVTATGSGFLPNEPVQFHLSADSNVASGSVTFVQGTATASGTFALTLTVPADAPLSGGPTAITYGVTAGGDMSGGRVHALFTVTAKPIVPAADTDGDGLLDAVDCNPTDKTKPAQGTGVVDKDCNGVNDMIQPVKFVGSKKNDKITTFNGNDTIKTGAGNDTIKSGGGNDKIDAGIGNDVVDAGAGNDIVAGGAGNDKLTGGTGKDKLNGGPGNDTINAKDKNNGDTIVCGPGKDTVLADKKDKVAKDCEKVKRR